MQETTTNTLTSMRQQPEWNDATWQMRQRAFTPTQFAAWRDGFQPSSQILAAARRYDMAITPYYASLIEKPTPSDPIFAMAVPQAIELSDPPELKIDPFGERDRMLCPGIIQRYPGRAVWLAAADCPVRCRHCTRKWAAGTPCETRADHVTHYLRAHTDIREILISGGDPLTLPTDQIERHLTALRALPHIGVIRIGSRAPVTLPMRIDDELCAMLKRHHPIWINTHFNHPRELTPEARAACTRLVDAGLPVGNQSVLLKDVNDQADTLAELFEELTRMRVRPYYIFHPDLVSGIAHFRPPLRRGLQIMAALRRRVSGIAMPAYILDYAPAGGKVPLHAHIIVGRTPTHIRLRLENGDEVEYPEMAQ